MRPRNEQFVAAMCHLFNIAPIYGLVIAGWVWFENREKSRRLVEQARQAMLFHCLLLAAVVVWSLVGLVGKLLTPLIAPVASALVTVNNSIMMALMIVYAGTCIVGAARCLAPSEKPFRYPLIGRRREL